jgi:hypothetical protein
MYRRDALIRLGQGTLGGLALPQLLAAEQQATAALNSQAAGSAKSCILIYLWGGPPQMDLWDPKPEAPDGIRSLFEPIATNVPGIQFTDQLPLMARHADKMCVVRSYTHESNVHEVGVYRTLAGKVNNTLAVPRNQRNRDDFPNMASIVAKFSPPGDLPASITIPRPIGHDGVTYTGTYAGFLGPRFDPLELQAPGEVQGPPPHSLELPPGLDTGRLQARLGLSRLLDEADRAAQQARFAIPAEATGLERFREQALTLLTAPKAKAALSIDGEPDALRDAYGRNEYGEAFLLSRRLIEAGVRLVSVIWYYVCPDGNVANVWDNHGGTGSLGGITGYQMLREKYCIPPLDQAYSALLEDLTQRGLLDETLVVMLGEFGRTPKINQAVGRDHWGPCQSIVLAGGGVRGGQVYGASDPHAAYPVKDPVTPEDLIATTYHCLGLPEDALIYDPQGRPHRISEGQILTGVL